MCTENYRTLLKEIKEETSNWNDIPRSQTGLLNTVDIFILHKVMYTYIATTHKIPCRYYRSGQNPKIHMEPPQEDKTILRAKSNDGD